MCTLTIVPGSGALPSTLFRVVVNRDEQRSRCEALPPVVRRFGAYDAILPIDPPSQGTWIGVNSAGVVLGLLNANPVERRPKPIGTRSRGDIIPKLLGAGDVRSAMSALLELDAREYPPFRLVAVEAGRIAVAAADGLQITVQSFRSLDQPFIATSSGLGDHLVEWPRRDLFLEIMTSGLSAFEAQDAFHRHSWPDCRHLSVEMSRPDARTVSRSVVEVGTDSVRLTYRSLSNQPAASSVVRARYTVAERSTTNADRGIFASSRTRTTA
ncbi:MAG: NRDE family protein [Phycisphaeraceae bacterium]|nr:NRDE family protein [Phycisphaeraceae bacterium]